MGNAAMGRKTGEVFFTDSASSGDHVVQSSSEGVRVPMVTIDDLIRQYPEIGHADFVKIDTEGYEVEIVPALTRNCSYRYPRCTSHDRRTIIGGGRKKW